MTRFLLILLWSGLFWLAIGLLAISFLGGCNYTRYEVIHNAPSEKDPSARYVVCESSEGECTGMMMNRAAAKLYPIGRVWWEKKVVMLPYLKENGK